MVTTIVLVVAAALFAWVLFHPRLLRAPLWQATVTPLASIIGSGFLVAGPILSQVAGNLAWAAMVGLCGLAYLFGAAVRYNIVHVEPLLANQPPAVVTWLERASDLALSLAYFVSVAYYLNLFAAFGLRLGGVVDPFWISVAATAAIAAVGMVGLAGGLHQLERLEVAAVGLKLSLIGGLIVTLLVASGIAVAEGSFAWTTTPHTTGLREASILLGLVILVQGFETSRYLGDAYDARTRVRTMRWAQLASSAIYVVFILLITVYFTGAIPEEGGETAIIDMLLPLGTLVGPLIIIAALASQLSASVADMNGAGGLLAESTKHRVSVNIGNLVTALAAIAITWVADIYEIIAYASKVFLVYYALQSAQAMLSARRQGLRGRAILYGFGTAVALIATVFAAPAAV